MADNGKIKLSTRVFYRLDEAIEFLEDKGIQCSRYDLIHLGVTRAVELLCAIPDSFEITVFHKVKLNQNKHETFAEIKRYKLNMPPKPYFVVLRHRQAIMLETSELCEINTFNEFGFVESNGTIVKINLDIIEKIIKDSIKYKYGAFQPFRLNLSRQFVNLINPDDDDLFGVGRKGCFIGGYELDRKEKFELNKRRFEAENFICKFDDVVIAKECLERVVSAQNESKSHIISQGLPYENNGDKVPHHQTKRAYLEVIAAMAKKHYSIDPRCEPYLGLQNMVLDIEIETGSKITEKTLRGYLKDAVEVMPKPSNSK
jgi:hypothetical protein